MKIALVEWGDICSTSTPTWQHKEDIEVLDAMSCITVGIILKETEEDIRIVLSLNPDDFSQEITILKPCIRRIRYLKVAK